MYIIFVIYNSVSNNCEMKFDGLLKPLNNLSAIF